MAIDVQVRSHIDTSGSGGLGIGLFDIDRADLPTYETFINDGSITFHLPINNLDALNQELNKQILLLYKSDIDAASGGSASITLTGDVTGSGTGSIATTIAANAVTLPKMAQIATDSFLGRDTAGTGDVEVLGAVTVKTMLSLNLVENTALSTWPGTTNITTLGAIVTGTWNATPVGLAYGGTGQTTQNAALNALLPSQTANATKFLQTDATDTSWQFAWVGPVTTGTIPLATGAYTFGDSRITDDGDMIVMGSASARFKATASLSQVVFGDTEGAGNGFTAIFDDTDGSFVTNADFVANTLDGIHQGSWIGTPIPVKYGGIALTSVAQGDLLYGSATDTYGLLADIATGNALISGGVGVAPSYGKIGLTTHISGILNVANGGTGSATQNFVDLTTAQTVAGVKNFTSDVKGLSFNGNNSTPTSAYFYYNATPASAPTGLAGANFNLVNNVNDANNGLYALTATVQQTIDRTAVNGLLYAAKFTATASANVQTAFGMYALGTVASGKTASELGGVQFATNVSGTATNMYGLLEVFTNNGTVGTGYANYSLLINAAAKTVTNWTGFRTLIINNGNAINTLKGIDFGTYTGSGTVVNNYLLYADATMDQGTTSKYCIYFLPDMPSYHIGKFGIGSGVTAPAARLTVRDTSEPLRLENSATVYAKFVVTATTGELVIDCVGSAPQITFSDDVKLSDKNLIFGTATGTKLGTATSQKLSFWNATPIVQPTTAVAAATFVANTSGIADDTATFDGYTIGQVVKALRNEGLLA